MPNGTPANEGHAAVAGARYGDGRRHDVPGTGYCQRAGSAASFSHLSDSGRGSGVRADAPRGYKPELKASRERRKEPAGGTERAL